MAEQTSILFQFGDAAIDLIVLPATPTRPHHPRSLVMRALPGRPRAGGLPGQQGGGLILYLIEHLVVPVLMPVGDR